MDIKRLLRKKKLTGRELGILVVTNMILTIKDKRPLVSKEKLQTALNNLSLEPTELEKYHKYSSIYSWLMCKHRECLGCMHQAQTQCRTLELITVLNTIGEDVLHTEDEIYKIMSKYLTKTAISDVISLIDGLRDRLESYTLEAFYPESETYTGNAEIAKEARILLVKDYLCIKGYNLALELISKTYEIPDITALRIEIETLEDIIKYQNNNFRVLNETICRIHAQQKKQREKKLKVIHEFFQPIDYKSLIIPESTVKEAEKLLKSPNAFTEEWDILFTKLLFFTLQGDR